MRSSQINAKVFINYRREDSAPYAGRLCDRLTARFGEDQVFIDIDQIEPGEDFVEVINRKVSACDIALVAIGPRWLSATDASGKRRLDDEEDFVRMEIVAVLQRKIRVIPVLVGGAQMPRKQDLPEALAPLSRRNAVELSEIRFNADVNRLIEAIEKSLADPGKKAESLPDRTTPRESTQRTPATPPVQSTSLIAVLKKPERLILVSAIALILLGLTWFFMTSGHQKVPKQGDQPAVANIPRRTANIPRRTANIPIVTANIPSVTANPSRVTANPEVGKPAPDFSLTTGDGSQVSLKDYRGKWVVLYFYPKDFTSGCTMEAHNFQRDLAKYEESGAVILGVSVDSVQSHKDFCAKEGLNFKLLADPDAKISTEYRSIMNYKGNTLAARNTFIINPKGEIAKVYTGVKPAEHSEQVLKDLADLKKS